MSVRLVATVMVAFYAITAAGPGISADDTSDLILSTIQQMDRMVAEVPTGEMDFEITLSLKEGGQPVLEKTKYAGRVAWKFPAIRWDYTERQISTVEKPAAKRIVIDSPVEVIKYYVTSGQVYRSPDRSKLYEKELRIAPWQTWFEFDGQVPVKKVFIDLLAKPGKRRATASVHDGVRNIAIAMEEPKSLLTFTFTSDRGVFTGYESVVEPGQRGFNAELRWKTVNGRLFPEYIFYRSSKDPELAKNPRVTMSFTNHRTDTAFSDADFTFSGLDLSDAKKITTYQEGQKPSVVTLKDGVAEIGSKPFLD